jgi:hypothetical protein
MNGTNVIEMVELQLRAVDVQGDLPKIKKTSKKLGKCFVPVVV